MTTETPTLAENIAEWVRAAPVGQNPLIDGAATFIAALTAELEAVRLELSDARTHSEGQHADLMLTIKQCRAAEKERDRLASELASKKSEPPYDLALALDVERLRDGSYRALHSEHQWMCDINEQRDRLARELAEAKGMRDELIAAAKVAIPETEHPAIDTYETWAWQIRTLGEDRRAAYRSIAELRQQLAEAKGMREALLEIAKAEPAETFGLADAMLIARAVLVAAPPPDTQDRPDPK